MIMLIAAGEVPAAVMKRLKKRLPDVFGLPVRTMSLRRPPRRAFNETRRQYDAIKIIERILENMPPGAEKALMVVNEDLFIPVLTHVIGEAQLCGAAGVVSLHRLRGNMPEGVAPSPRDALELLGERTLKEAVHEIGHTFGLVHCRDFLCPMSVSGDARQVDSKGAALCGPCGFLLSKKRAGDG